MHNAASGLDYSNIDIHFNNFNQIDGQWQSITSNNDFQDYYVGLGGGSTGVHVGPEIGIAYEIANSGANESEAWYIIKFTAAGTYLDGAWYPCQWNTINPGSSRDEQGVKAQTGEYIATHMLNFVKADLDKIVSIHGADNVDIKSFVWMQGESEAGHELCTPYYKTTEQQLVLDIRNTFNSYDKVGSIQFVNAAIEEDKNIDVNGVATSVWPASDIVNKAKTENCATWYVPETDSETVLGQNYGNKGVYTNSNAAIADSVWIDTSTLISKYENNNENNENDPYHYCGESMLKLGQWMGKAILGTMK